MPSKTGFYLSISRKSGDFYHGTNLQFLHDIQNKGILTVKSADANPGLGLFVAHKPNLAYHRFIDTQGVGNKGLLSIYENSVGVHQVYILPPKIKRYYTDKSRKNECA
jgi:hypothetical protein